MDSQFNRVYVEYELESKSAEETRIEPGNSWAKVKGSRVY